MAGDGCGKTLKRKMTIIPTFKSSYHEKHSDYTGSADSGGGCAPIAAQTTLDSKQKY